MHGIQNNLAVSLALRVFCFSFLFGANEVTSLQKIKVQALIGANSRAGGGGGF